MLMEERVAPVSTSALNSLPSSVIGMMILDRSCTVISTAATAGGDQ